MASSPPGAARIRFTTATERVRGHSLTVGPVDAGVLREAGYPSPAAFWDVALSDTMLVSQFIRLLDAFLLDPSVYAEEALGRATPIAAILDSALRKAYADGELWLVGDAAEWGQMRLRAMPAARWFFDRPLYRDHLPDLLQAYLAGDAIKAEAGEGASPVPKSAEQPRPARKAPVVATKGQQKTVPATKANRARGDKRRERARELKAKYPSWGISRVAKAMNTEASNIRRLLGPEKEELFPSNRKIT